MVQCSARSDGYGYLSQGATDRAGFLAGVPIATAKVPKRPRD
jgi:hypothetical protein